MSTDVNEYIADDFIARTIDLERYSVSEQKKLLKILKQLERDLSKQITERGKVGTFTTARLEALLRQTRATIATAYKRITKDQRNALAAVTRLEKQFFADTLNKHIGASVMTVAVDDKYIKRVLDTTLIQGAPSADWWARQSKDLQTRFSDTIRAGVLAGETTDQLARRIRGTQKKNFTDGIMPVTRAQANAIVRTSVQTIANRARRDAYEEQSDIMKGVQQRSTLDTRTTPICMAYSNNQWKMVTQGNSVEYEPIDDALPFVNLTRDGARHEGPPRHWQCRSTLVPVLRSWEELSGKKIKVDGKEQSFRKRFEERLAARGFSKERIATIRANTQASMNGQVSRDINFNTWLKTQSTARQIEALGAGRYRLWKEGKIKNLRELVDQYGRPLTLDELIAKTTGKTKTTSQETKEKKKEIKREKVSVIPDHEKDFVPAATIEEAEALRKLLIEEGLNDPLYLRREDGKPFKRFKGDVTEFGAYKLPNLTLDAQNDLNQQLIHLRRLSKELKMPMLQGVTENVEGAACASMGDGVLNVNARDFNFYARKRRLNTVARGIEVRETRVRSLEIDLGPDGNIVYGLAEARKAKDKEDIAAWLEIKARSEAELKRLKDELNILRKMDPKDTNTLADANTSTWKLGDDINSRPWTSENFFPEYREMENTLLHEYGHHIHQQWNVSTGFEYLVDPPLEAVLNATFQLEFLKPGARPIKPNGYRGQLARTVLTSYAETNAQELFAESFATRYMGRADLIDPAYNRILDRVFERLES
jgi:hypothetical protein